MTLGDDVNLEDFITAKDDLSGADIKVFKSFRINFYIVCSFPKNLSVIIKFLLEIS